MKIQCYRHEFKNLLESTFLPEGISIDEQKVRLLPLSNHIIEHLPNSLYRYRDCSEKNIEAFNDDKLYAVTADKFNDPYDCLFRYDKEGLRNSIMLGMSKDVIYALREHLRSRGDFPDILKTVYAEDLLDNVKSSIKNATDDMIEEYLQLTNQIKEDLDTSIDQLTDKAVKSVKLMTFIACFSEDIHSVTMWSHYANSHNGFALEYDSRVFQLRCQICDKLKQCNKAAVCNLYPVIYQRQRYDATNYLVWYIGRSMGIPIKNTDTFTTSKLILYKSSQWSYEKEWRLIVSKINEFEDKKPFCIYYIRPKAIYYGTRISPINKKMLHLIAKEKGIDEYQMYIDDKSYNYSVKQKKL